MANLRKKTVSAKKTEAMMLTSFLQAVAGEERFFNKRHELFVYLDGDCTDEKVVVASVATPVLKELELQFDNIMSAKFSRHVHMKGKRIFIGRIEA